MVQLSDLLHDPATFAVAPVVRARVAAGAGSLEDTFSEEPVSLDTFVTDSFYMDSPALSPVQYDAVRHIERIYLPDTYALMGQEWAYWSQPVRMTNLITLQWGKGSGKDHICRVASLRIAYLLLCLKAPQVYFEMPAQDTITMLNIASSSAQAERAFFKPMTRVVKKGWFADKCDPKQAVIEYAKNVEAVSGHSDAEGQEGGNLILGVADEIDAFKSKEETERYRGNAIRESARSAEAILDMLHTSASTRFPESYKNVRISYPRYLGSTIQKLTKEARDDNAEYGEESGSYVSGPLLTWEVNPRYDRFPKVRIAQTEALVPDLKAFKDDYRRDPDLSKAKYECRPSRAIDTYFKNIPAFRAAVTSSTQPIEVDYDLRTFRSDVTGQVVTTWEPVFTIDPSFVPMEGALYGMHADLAIKADRAGVAMAHVQRYQESVDIAVDEEGGHVEQTHQLPHVKLDFVISFGASTEVSPPREIQIRWVRQLIFELIRRGFQIRVATYDGFQSTDSMQQLSLHGIESERKSTDLDEGFWRTLRDVTYEGRLEMPFSPLLFLELESLGRFGNKVDHPPSGSKDLADATAIAVSNAIELGGAESGVQAWVGDAQFHVGGFVPLTEGYADINPFSPHTDVIRESPTMLMFG